MMADMEGQPGSGGRDSQSGSEAAPRGGGASSAQQQPPEAAQGPTLSNYLEFGRLMGESPQEVQKRLALADMSLAVDDASRQYLQAWEEEEEEQYRMFEAVLEAQLSGYQPAGTSRTSKTLQRNKNRAAAVVDVERLREAMQARQQGGGQTVRISAAERKLARSKQGSIALRSFSGATPPAGEPVQFLVSCT